MKKPSMRYDVTFYEERWVSVNTPDQTGRFTTRKKANKEADRLNRLHIENMIGKALTKQIRRLFR